MNKIYKSVWNESTGSWVAAPETARAAGGGGSSSGSAALTEPAQAPAWTWATLRPSCLSVCLALAASVTPAWAATPTAPVAPAANQLPTGGQVVAGQAQINTPNANTLNVTQSSHDRTRLWLVASISF